MKAKYCEGQTKDNKDQTIITEGKWIKIKVRKLVNKVVAPRMGHPNLAK